MLMMKREIERNEKEDVRRDSLVPIQFLFFIERYMTWIPRPLMMRREIEREEQERC